MPAFPVALMWDNSGLKFSIILASDSPRAFILIAASVFKGSPSLALYSSNCFIASGLTIFESFPLPPPAALLDDLRSVANSLTLPNLPSNPPLSTKTPFSFGITPILYRTLSIISCFVLANFALWSGSFANDSISSFERYFVTPSTLIGVILEISSKNFVCLDEKLLLFPEGVIALPPFQAVFIIDALLGSAV